jgi:dihydroorotate dehydrogenase
LQSDSALDALLDALARRREQLAEQHGASKPIFIKIAPDLEPEQIDVISVTMRRYGFDAAGKPTQSFGLIATNTTLSRDAVQGMPHAGEAGGLSGAPVLEMSNRVIAQLRGVLGKGFPIIGVGGVLSGKDAASKLRAGADLVQIYTGLIYKGPALVAQAARALKAAAKA